MKIIKITCIIAYAGIKSKRNIINLINTLSLINHNSFKNVNLKKIKVTIIVGWNKLSGLDNINPVLKNININTLPKHIHLKFEEIDSQYDKSSKAYFTWGHCIKNNQEELEHNDFYFFFKDNYNKVISVSELETVLNYQILRRNPVVYYECVKNINTNFHLKKLAYQHKDEFILFPRTQFFILNKQAYKYLLELDFFFSNKFQKKQRQYDLFKVLIHKFNNYTFKLRICDDEGDNHTVEIENNINLNKITSN